MARVQLRRRAHYFTRLPMIAFVANRFEIQVLPNPYVFAFGYDLAIDREGILFTTPRRVFGWMRKVGWHYRRI